MIFSTHNRGRVESCTGMKDSKTNVARKKRMKAGPTYVTNVVINVRYRAKIRPRSAIRVGKESRSVRD